MYTPRPPAIPTLAALAISVLGFGCEPPAQETLPEPELTSVEIYAPVNLKPFLETLEDEYFELNNRALFTTTSSQAMLNQHARSSSVADLVVLTQPDEELVGVLKPWISERLVIFTLETNEVTELDQLESARGYIASVTELEPLGLYTRLAMRAANLWSSLETRVRFHTGPDEVIQAVLDSTVGFGITYASHIPPDTPIRIIADLHLPESVRADYAIVTLTEDGQSLAAWLLDQAVIEKALQAGYAH